MIERYVAVICFKEADCLYTTEVSKEFSTEEAAMEVIRQHLDDEHFDFGVVEKRYRKNT